MSKTIKTVDDVDALPGYIRAGYGLDRSWVVGALCRTPQADVVGLAWRAHDKDLVRVGGDVIPGRRLVAMALEICKRCPVQWRCAAYAVESEASVGTWGTNIARIRWLQQTADWKAILEAAEEMEMPVHEAVKRVMVARRGRVLADGF